jgi:hypothetical protein
MTIPGCGPVICRTVSSVGSCDGMFERTMGDFAADARPIVATNAVNADRTFMLGMYGIGKGE